MAKKNKITSAMIAKAMELVDKETTTIICGADDNSIEIPVKTQLSLSERAMLVNDIVNTVFIESDNGIKYCPTFKKFAIDFYFVSYFTDIALPTNSDKANKFLEQSRISDKIADAIPNEYILDIIREINEAIDYRKQEVLKKSKFDIVFDKVLGIVQEVSKNISGIDISQIMDYVDKNAPEFKGQIEEMIKETTAIA